MVKVCNQSLIVTWLLLLLFWTCCSWISGNRRKWKKKRKNLDLPAAIADLQYLQAHLFIRCFSCRRGYFINNELNFVNFQAGFGARRRQVETCFFPLLLLLLLIPLVWGCHLVCAITSWTVIICVCTTDPVSADQITSWCEVTSCCFRVSLLSPAFGTCIFPLLISNLIRMNKINFSQ